MRSGAKVMFTIAAFLAVMTVIYVTATGWIDDDASLGGLEWTGSVALVLAFLLAIMLGGYLQFSANRIDLLPEDFEEAEIQDGAGTYGFFSPESIWPFAMAMGVLVFGLGVAFFFYWLIILGGVILIWATTMLNLQYGLPKEKH